MTPMRRMTPMQGPDLAAMAPPSPMQFAAPPPMLDAPDATGAQAIGGLANLAMAFQNRPQGQVGGAGGGLAGMMGGGPTDAPPRRKSSFAQTAAANYA